MPPPDSGDAQAAYALQSALVQLRMEELQRALEAHEAVRPLSWRGAAELIHVEQQLAEIVARLVSEPRGP